MRAALDIALKDLRQKVRDRSALLISIVAPFVLAALFAMILGGLDEDFHASWGYVDLDGGEVAAALDEGPISGMESEGVVDIERYASADEARQAVEAGEVGGDAFVVATSPGTPSTPIEPVIEGSPVGPASLAVIVAEPSRSTPMSCEITEASVSRLSATTSKRS